MIGEGGAWVEGYIWAVRGLRLRLTSISPSAHWNRRKNSGKRHLERTKTYAFKGALVTSLP